MNEILQCSDVQVMQEGNIFGLLFDQNKKFLCGHDNATHVINENGGITARMASQNNTDAAGVDILSIAYAEKSILKFCIIYLMAQYLMVTVLFYF